VTVVAVRVTVVVRASGAISPLPRKKITPKANALGDKIQIKIP
jgi:hypothetical protein